MSKDDPRSLEFHTIRQLMLTEDGRAFMFRCLQHCGTYDSVFHEDPCKHAYNSGARDHGLWLERELREAADQSFLKMLKENRDDN